MKVKKEETFAEMFQREIDTVVLDGSEPEEPQYLTTVVISSKRAGHCMQALDRIQELAKASGRILAFTKLYDDVYLDRFGKFPKGISPNRDSGRFHQFILKSNYTLDELSVVLDPLNFPEYSYYSQLSIVRIGI